MKVALGSLKSGKWHLSPYLLWEEGRGAWAVGTGVLSCRQQPLATASSGHWEDYKSVHLSRVPPRLPPALVTARSLRPGDLHPRPARLLFLDWAAPPKARVPFLSFIHTAGTWTLDWKLDSQRKLCSLCPSCLFPGMFGFSVFIPQRKHPQGSSCVSPDALPPCPLVLVDATRPDVCHLSQSSGSQAESMPVLLPCARHTVGAQ